MFKAKEVLLSRLDSDQTRYVAPEAVKIALADGWVLHCDSERDSAVDYTPNWLDIVWGKMTLGKLPTIREIIVTAKQIIDGMTTAGWFLLAVVLASPLAFVAAYFAVEFILYTR